jgi:CO/xanthine dehydrogenase Mo-binding subunit
MKRFISPNKKADLRFGGGKVAIRLGLQAMGQGHLSTLPRIVAKRLGIDVDDVKLIEGDSDEVPEGTPSVASRSLMMGGSAATMNAIIDALSTRGIGHLDMPASPERAWRALRQESAAQEMTHQRACGD